MTQAQIELSSYNSEWPIEFEKEKNALQVIAGEWLHGSIEHVGSTAVPGLAAKPVIDIMFGVKSLQESRPAIDVLVEFGYLFYPYKKDVMHWFCKPSDEYRTHHLHLIPYQSSLWKERILFRNLLRSDRSISKEYQELKKELAVKYRFDRESYTNDKWPFIKQVLEREKRKKIANKRVQSGTAEPRR